MQTEVVDEKKAREWLRANGLEKLLATPKEPEPSKTELKKAAVGEVPENPGPYPLKVYVEHEGQKLLREVEGVRFMRGPESFDVVFDPREEER